MRFFQKRMLSGSPSRSRGPGRSSRKKSASWASKERNPLGTTFRGRWSDEGVMAGVAGPAGGADLLPSPRMTSASCNTTCSMGRRQASNQCAVARWSSSDGPG